MKRNEDKLIWESMRLPAGKVGQLHRKEMSAGEAGKPHGDETPVLEGVNCSCKNCVHWVVGDLCGAEEISLSKIPNDDYGAVVICETFEVGGSNEQ